MCLWMGGQGGVEEEEGGPLSPREKTKSWAIPKHLAVSSVLNVLSVLRFLGFWVDLEGRILVIHTCKYDF